MPIKIGFINKHKFCNFCKGRSVKTMELSNNGVQVSEDGIVISSD